MTVTGGVVAVAIAVAASPLTPLGPARVAEPDPGIEVNFAVLGAGLAVVALLPLALLAGAAWRAAASGRPPRRRRAGPAGARPGWAGRSAGRGR